MHLHPDYHALLAAQRSADLIALGESSRASSARRKRKRASWRRWLGSAWSQGRGGFSLGPAQLASDPGEKRAQADTGEKRNPGSLHSDGPRASFVCGPEDACGPAGA
jgi:hypothetical protein